MHSQRVRVFSTCPSSMQYGQNGAEYLHKVEEAAGWCEDAGLEGMLVYTDNSHVDPWLVSQVILSGTSNLAPLVAVQPVYMHPYAAAKMVATFSHLYDRRICLNMVAGGFRNDLIALDGFLEHDERYDRLTEYTLIMKHLLSEPGPVTFDGKYFSVENLSMQPAMRPGLMPEIFVSGTSPAGITAARKIGATLVSYPGSPGVAAVDADMPTGIRIGIIARAESAEAWRVAHERYPPDRKGRLIYALARKVSDSAWHAQLAELEDGGAEDDSPYWLVPFKNYKTFCPYLVGSYRDVRSELAKYVQAGFRTFILDIPPSKEELEHTSMAFADLTT